MVQLSGILSSVAVASNVSTQNQLIVSVTEGPSNFVTSNTITVSESGYYIISANIVSQTASIGLNLISQASIALVLLHNTITYRSDCLGRPTASSGTTNLAQAELCIGLFLKANDTLTMKWINYSSLTTSASGIFNVSKILPTSAVTGTLTSAAVAVNATTQYPLTMTPTQSTISNNRYTCNFKGLILVSAYIELPSTTNTSRYTLVIKYNSVNYFGEQFVDSLSPFTASISFSKLFRTAIGDVITFHFVASGSGTTVTPSKGVFTIVRL